jgi:hypothetical protein
MCGFIIIFLKLDIYVFSSRLKKIKIKKYDTFIF